MRFAHEGLPYVFGLGLASVGAGLLVGWWAGLALFVATLAVAAFFRDPDRVVPGGEGTVVSPADGRVVSIVDDCHPESLPGQSFRRVSIFMSPANVHVNRAPVSGEVVSVRHSPGKFLGAFREEASTANERNEVVIRCEDGQLLAFVQIAGWMARRIICRLEPGQRVRRGERFGLIMFGSRVDVFLPSQATITASVGDRIRAGADLVGEL